MDRNVTYIFIYSSTYPPIYFSTSLFFSLFSDLNCFSLSILTFPLYSTPLSLPPHSLYFPPPLSISFCRSLHSKYPLHNFLSFASYSFQLLFHFFPTASYRSQPPSITPDLSLSINSYLVLPTNHLSPLIAPDYSQSNSTTSYHSIPSLLTIHHLPDFSL